jgi:purine nucleoside phosphorylase
LTNVPSGAYAKKTILRVIVVCWTTDADIWINMPPAVLELLTLAVRTFTPANILVYLQKQ